MASAVSDQVEATSPVELRVNDHDASAVLIELRLGRRDPGEAGAYLKWGASFPKVGENSVRREWISIYHDDTIDCWLRFHPGGN